MDLKENNSSRIETIKVGDIVKKEGVRHVTSANYALISVWKQRDGEKVCVSKIKIENPITFRNYEGKDRNSNSEQLLYRSIDGKEIFFFHRLKSEDIS